MTYCWLYVMHVGHGTVCMMYVWREWAADVTLAGRCKMGCRGEGAFRLVARIF